MKKTVYIETTIPSYYYETRQDVKSIAWREITKEWWKKYRNYYLPVCSEIVLIELERGTHPSKEKKLSLLKNIELLKYLPIIEDIAEEYIRNLLMPREFVGDAYHLAYVSYYKIDFMITWNCNHLANPNKFHHLNVINSRLNLHTPVICTPEQLLIKGEE
jgi:predicted nucleic acid-binding protein